MAKLDPSPAFADLVRCFTVVESDQDVVRKLIPEPGIIIGLRYRGFARQLDRAPEVDLPDATVTGLRTSSRRMFTAAGSGILLAHLHDAAAPQIFPHALHEIFEQTVPLDRFLPQAAVTAARVALTAAPDDEARRSLFERFLEAHRQPTPPDPVVLAATRAIRASGGVVRVAGLAAELGLGVDALEKRFRSVVGASPKQFASILRMRLAVESYRPGDSLTRLSLDAGYFDQSHFIREFRAVTGEAPRRFFADQEHC